MVGPSAATRNIGLVFDSSLRFRTHVTEYVRNDYHKLKVIYNNGSFIDRISLCIALAELL